jgi:hypothetical protein
MDSRRRTRLVLAASPERQNALTVSPYKVMRLCQELSPSKTVESVGNRGQGGKQEGDVFCAPKVDHEILSHANSHAFGKDLERVFPIDNTSAFDDLLRKIDAQPKHGRSRQ